MAFLCLAPNWSKISGCRDAPAKQVPAGRDDSAHHPQGVEAARTLNLALKRALAKKD
jgi:hypothetical protein